MNKDQDPFNRRPVNFNEILASLMAQGKNPDQINPAGKIRVMAMDRNGKIVEAKGTDDPELNHIIDRVTKALQSADLPVDGIKVDKTFNPFESISGTSPGLSEQSGQELLAEVEEIFDDNLESEEGRKTTHENYIEMVLLQTSAILEVANSYVDKIFSEKQLLSKMVELGLKTGMSRIASCTPQKESRQRLEALAAKYNVPLWVVKAAYVKIALSDFTNPSVLEQVMEDFDGYLAKAVV